MASATLAPSDAVYLLLGFDVCVVVGRQLLRCTSTSNDITIIYIFWAANASYAYVSNAPLENHRCVLSPPPPPEMLRVAQLGGETSDMLPCGKQLMVT